MDLTGILIGHRTSVSVCQTKGLIFFSCGGIGNVCVKTK